VRHMKCLAGAAVFCLMFLVANALACSCGGGGSPCDNFGRASAVFVGTAISLRTVERQHVQMFS